MFISWWFVLLVIMVIFMNFSTFCLVICNQSSIMCTFLSQRKGKLSQLIELLWTTVFYCSTGNVVMISVTPGSSGREYRPYALTSHLHNNDAMLGVKTCRAARTCCAGIALALSRCADPARPGPAVWHAGFGPLAACLAMAHVTVPRLTPNMRGRPTVTSYA